MNGNRFGGQTPQGAIEDFWEGYISKRPGKVTLIFPSNLYASLLPAPHKRGEAPALNATESYNAAAAECRETVRQIVQECHRTNEKFTDADFDITTDPWNCLLSLTWQQPPPSIDPKTADKALEALQSICAVGDQLIPVNVNAIRNILAGKAPEDNQGSAGNPTGDDFDPEPGSMHRVNWIFEKPQFTVDGFSSSDIKQGGASEDCWWLSAIATICHRKDLMDKVCVARDEECGVYGFAFFRDGKWIWTVVDDNLFLSYNDFDMTGAELYDPSHSEARKYRKAKQTGSDALFFATCDDQNETWLPLMEKAFAKVHGDYNAICGGYVGQGTEDLTGGVATAMNLENILGKDRLWKELLQAGDDFTFGLDILGDNVKNGLASGHAYSIIKVLDAEDQNGKVMRLVKVRNPWGARSYDGVGEWTGPWSDGSKEWNAYWMNKLDYQFGNDGVFFMSYEDMLSTFTTIHKTRLFDNSWTVIQEWTSVEVAWLSGYIQQKFIVEIKKPGLVVFVLSQLDTRYFRGFEGQYAFQLRFILTAENSKPGEYLCRARPHIGNFYGANRSVSCEIDLPAGRYEVLPKILARRDVGAPTVEEVVSKMADRKPKKLQQIGISYDLAHQMARKPIEEKLPTPSLAPRVNGSVQGEPTQTTAVAPEPEKKSEPEAKNTPETNGSDPQPSTGDAPTADAPPNSSTPNGNSTLPLTNSQAPEVSSSTPLPPPSDYNPQPTNLNVPDLDQPGPFADNMGGPPIQMQDYGGQGQGQGGPPPPAPWNAVCVIGLRVYAKDPDVSITISEPGSVSEKETANMVVNESIQASAAAMAVPDKDPKDAKTDVQEGKTNGVVSGEVHKETGTEAVEAEDTEKIGEKSEEKERDEVVEDKEKERGADTTVQEGAMAAETTTETV